MGLGWSPSSNMRILKIGMAHLHTLTEQLQMSPVTTNETLPTLASMVAPANTRRWWDVNMVRTKNNGDMTDNVGHILSSS